MRLWRRDTQALQSLLDRPVPTLRDEQGEREETIACVCRELGEAVAGADLILIPSLAVAQHDIAQARAPHLGNGQVVYLLPGTPLAPPS